MQWNQIYPWLAGLGIAILLWFMFKLASTTNLIKDLSRQVNKPYSLASSQLFWWTAIILSCFIWKGFQQRSLPALNTLALLLLGISATTTLSGKVIDNADRNTVGENRHQDKDVSKNFLRDILSDGQGNYSIHRLQTFLFNVIIGIIYLIEFINKSEFPTWDSAQVSALLGISDAGYIAIKNTENEASKVMPPPLPAVGGVLPAPGSGANGGTAAPVAPNLPAETIISATE